MALGDLAGSEGDLGGLTTGYITTIGGVKAIGVLVYLRAIEVDDFGVVTGDTEVVDVIRIAVILTTVLMFEDSGLGTAKLLLYLVGSSYYELLDILSPLKEVRFLDANVAATPS